MLLGVMVNWIVIMVLMKYLTVQYVKTKVCFNALQMANVYLIHPIVMVLMIVMMAVMKVIVQIQYIPSCNLVHSNIMKKLHW